MPARSGSKTTNLRHLTGKEANTMANEKRGNLYHIDPLDLRIVGGASLPEDERGPLDTELSVDDALYDERLLLSLDPIFVAGINAVGVIEPLKVAKLDGVPTIIFGRQRARAARLVNKLRAAKGEMPLTVPYVLEQSRDEQHLFALMVMENEHRRGDEYPTRIAKIKRALERGADADTVALWFKMKPAQVRAWLKFDADACDAVREAVEGGRLSVSAGMELVRAGDAEAQRQALAALYEQPVHAEGDLPPEQSQKTKKVSTQAARNAAKKTKKGADANTGDTCTKRELRKMLQACLDKDHPKNTSERTLAFWEGVENMLMLMLGDDEADKRLVDMLDRVRAPEGK